MSNPFFSSPSFLRYKEQVCAFFDAHKGARIVLYGGGGHTMALLADERIVSSLWGIVEKKPQRVKELREEVTESLTVVFINDIEREHIDYFILSSFSSAASMYCELFMRNVPSGKILDFYNNAEIDAAQSRLADQWNAAMQQWRFALKDVQWKPLRADAPKVLFAPLSGHLYTTVLHSLLSVALTVRNVKPYILVCDGVFPACDASVFGNHCPCPGSFRDVWRNPHESACGSCTYPMKRFLSDLPVEMITLKDYLRHDDYARLLDVVNTIAYSLLADFSYKGVAVGEEARASVLRQRLTGSLKHDTLDKWLLRRYVLSAMLMVDLGERVLKDIKPQTLFMQHGVYATHGTFLRLARQQDVHAVLHWQSYRKDTLLCAHDETYHRKLMHEDTGVWEHMNLTGEENTCIDEYMRARSSGGLDYKTYVQHAVDAKKDIAKALDLAMDKPIIGLFTNVMWDAQIFYEENAFSSMQEWLFMTIDHFIHHPELQLVIRVHPAEKVDGRGTTEPIVNDIVAEYPTLPKNIKIVGPADPINSYALLELIKVGLVYCTKMSVEMVFRGIPCIISGEAFMRNKGFAYDITSKAQYADMLENILDVAITPEMQERARKYAYHFFFRRMIDLPFIQIERMLQMDDFRLRVDTCDDLMPGNNANLDMLCEGIVKGTPFMVERTHDSLGV